VHIDGLSTTAVYGPPDQVIVEVPPAGGAFRVPPVGVAAYNEEPKIPNTKLMRNEQVA
jgi:hypothetical protein